MTPKDAPAPLEVRYHGGKAPPCDHRQRDQYCQAYRGDPNYFQGGISAVASDTLPPSRYRRRLLKSLSQLLPIRWLSQIDFTRPEDQATKLKVFCRKNKFIDIHGNIEEC